MLLGPVLLALLCVLQAEGRVLSEGLTILAPGTRHPALQLSYLAFATEIPPPHPTPPQRI